MTVSSAPGRSTPRTFPKPVLVISECLEFEPCRYNGARIHFDLVNALAPHVEYRPVCPEVQVGLEDFSARFLDGLDEVDGFILKSRSPSCGPGSVKIFARADAGGVVRRGAGLFAAAVLERHGHLAVEDEGRLRNHRIREHFLTKLFAIARLRELGGKGRIADLVRFHAAYKFLLLAYSERGLRALGRVVANHRRGRFDVVFAEYRAGFLRALRQTPRYTSMINVFQHISGFFRRELGRGEKAHFAGLLDRYREGRVPASAVALLLESWAIRFGSGYILDQALFAPFPEALASPADSGKGRAAGRYPSQ